MQPLGAAVDILEPASCSFWLKPEPEGDSGKTREEVNHEEAVHRWLDTPF